MNAIPALLFRCLTILLFGVVQVALPGRARSGVFFSVSVPDDFFDSPEARRLLRSYRLQVLGWLVVAEGLAVVSVIFDSTWTLLASLAAVAGGNSWAYLRAWKATRPFAAAPSAERTASLAADREGFPAAWINIPGPFLILAGAAIFVRAQWDRVADPLPVFGNLAGGTAMDLLLVALAWGILRASRRATPVRRINLISLAAFLWTTSAAAALAAILPLYAQPYELVPRLLPFAVLAAAALVLAWAIRKTRRARDGRDRTPDECWKLGQFYYNPQDPALLVERRFGLGYSFNFANRLAWVVLGAIAIVPLVVLAAVSLA